MKHTRWILFASLIVLLFSGACGTKGWLNHPMSQTLALRTPTPIDTQKAVQQISTQTFSTVEKTSTVVSAMPTITSTIPPTEIAKNCRNSGITRLLVIGVNTPTEEELQGAYAIRLVTINFNQPSATIISLPALLWVDTPILANLGVKEIQLSMVYTKAYYAAEGASADIRSQKGTEALAQTIIDNFSFVPDHYIILDESAFIKHVDALGGIEINLPNSVDGTSEGYGVYPAGPQLLDGTRALNFARLYHPGGMKESDNQGNLLRQNLVIRSILAAILKPQNWTKIPALVKNVHQAINTDLSLTQAIDLACIAGKIGESIRILAVGEDTFKVDNMGRMIPNLEVIKNLINEMDKDN